jgi:hypothetical protein
MTSSHTQALTSSPKSGPKLVFKLNQPEIEILWKVEAA